MLTLCPYQLVPRHHSAFHLLRDMKDLEKPLQGRTFSFLGTEYHRELWPSKNNLNHSPSILLTSQRIDFAYAIATNKETEAFWLHMLGARNRKGRDESVFEKSLKLERRSVWRVSLQWETSKIYARSDNVFRILPIASLCLQ